MPRGCSSISQSPSSSPSFTDKRKRQDDCKAVTSTRCAARHVLGRLKPVGAFGLVHGRLYLHRDGDCLAPSCTYQRDAHPILAWLKQQILEITPWGKVLRFLTHDNDGIFGQYRDRQPGGEKRRRYRCHPDLWLKEFIGIEGRLQGAKQPLSKQSLIFCVNRVRSCWPTLLS